MNRVFQTIEAPTQEQQQVIFLWPDTISEEEDFLLGKKADYVIDFEDDEE